MRRRHRFAAIGISMMLAFAGPAAAVTPALGITVEPVDATADNCWPFAYHSATGWGPFMGFVYKNVPAFSLVPSDRIAFDLGVSNDTDIRLQIDIAPTSTNGGDVPAAAFTTIVPNHALPLGDKNGDDVIGNYELVFGVENAFSFAGGGLILRFSSAAGDFATDTTCDGQVSNGEAGDPSDQLVSRFFNDADGAFPWDVGDDGDIGGFRILGDLQRVLTIAYAPRQQLVHGTLFAQYQGCVADWRIRLWKKVSGPDTLLAVGRTNEGGNYAIPARLKKGKFYTTADERDSLSGHCLPATSKTLTRR